MAIIVPHSALLDLEFISIMKSRKQFASFFLLMNLFDSLAAPNFAAAAAAADETRNKKSSAFSSGEYKHSAAYEWLDVALEDCGR